jgi:hypothetical protein
MVANHPSNTWTIHAALRRCGAPFYRACRGISSPHTGRTDAGETIAVAGVTVSRADRVIPSDVAEIETSKSRGRPDRDVGESRTRRGCAEWTANRASGPGHDHPDFRSRWPAPSLRPTGGVVLHCRPSLPLNALHRRRPGRSRPPRESGVTVQGRRSEDSGRLPPTKLSVLAAHLGCP